MEINTAHLEGDIARMQVLILLHPDRINTTIAGSTWLHGAARDGDIDLVRFLVERGADVNLVANESYGPPLMAAIHGESLVAVEYLLQNGANPGINRPYIAAINCADQQVGLGITKMLVEYGADFNCVYSWFGDKKVVFTPLSWAITAGKVEIASYLRSVGATMPPGKADPGLPTVADQIVAHFTEKCGPVFPQSQQEIVATGPPISIHVVPPSEGRNHITLFTTGMSQQAMNVPAGAEQLQYAELAINLPANWPMPQSPSKSSKLFGWFGKGNQNTNTTAGLWPFQWLRTIARYPHENNTWLGGAAVIFANGDPPQPLASGVPFTSLLMLLTDEVKCTEGRVVQIYQLIPLYTEERALEMAEGIPALLQALDKNNISWVMDPKRLNVAKLKG